MKETEGEAGVPSIVKNVVDYGVMGVIHRDTRAHILSVLRPPSPIHVPCSCNAPHSRSLASLPQLGRGAAGT